MSLSAKQDHERFKKIVRGIIKGDLKKYITKGELIGKRGKDLVSIPVPQIDPPTFRYSRGAQGGVGQGDGEEGDILATGEDEEGNGEAGNMPGSHIMEVDITLEELATILGEELELPKIKPKGDKHIITENDRYSQVRRLGPESLRTFKRTYKEAMKRQIIEGNYQDGDPIVPIREDRRYLSSTKKPKPEVNAAVIYIMDVSGSMGDEQKEIVRLESFWIDAWLRKHYPGLVTRYIIHDAYAQEVSEEKFYHTRESGGTMISSAYNLFYEMIDLDYDLELWNIYAFHFSDGDNWGGNDTSKCIDILRNLLLPNINLFCYGQVKSDYGSGEFLKDLGKNFGDEDNLITSEIGDKDDIYDSIKTFLGKGK